MRHFIVIFFMLLVNGLRAQSQPVPYTLEDRERLIRLEERFVALDKKIEAQGVSLTDKIEAQGVSLTEKIEAQVASLTDKIEAQGEALNKRIDALSKRMDEMQTFLLWGFGMTFTFMLGLVGFVLWDRRSYLKPVMADTRELMENEQRLLRVLKDYSKNDPKLADILRANGL